MLPNLIIFREWLHQDYVRSNGIIKIYQDSIFFNSVKTIEGSARCSFTRGQESGTLRTQYIEHERADR